MKRHDANAKPETKKAQRKTSLARPELVTVGNAVVKIYTRSKYLKAAQKDYTVHEVADYTLGTRRMLSFSNHDKAKAKAEEIARALSSGDLVAAQMRGTDTASYGRAVELIRETGDPLELVASRYATCFKILGDGAKMELAARYYVQHNPDTLPSKTVAEVVNELLAVKENRGKSERYLQDLRARLNRFAGSFHVAISSVATADVQHWLDRLKKAPQTVKNYRTVLHGLFTFSESRGYIFKGSNPVAATEAIQANGDAVAIYTPAEMARLLAAAKPDFSPCLALAAFAGLRSAEIERLEWSDIDLQGGHITISANKAKTASRRIVPIAANLGEWLKPCSQRTGKVWKGTHEDFYDAQQVTAAATGTDNAAALRWKANALRHSYASYRLAQTQSAAQVALEMGNSPSVVFRHYRELTKPADAVKWFAISPQAPANVISMEKAA